MNKSAMYMNDTSNPEDLLSMNGRALEERVRDWATSIDEEVQMEILQQSKSVADETVKALVRNERSEPIAVVLLSAANSPDLVARGVRNAEAIRTMLGRDLGKAVIEPIESGWIDGMSYVILPHCTACSMWQPRRFVQRMRIRRALLKWLRTATVTAVKNSSISEEVTRSYHSVLEHIEKQKLFNENIQIAIRIALHRIDSGHWRPRHTFDHNDLHLGNVMLPPRARNGATWSAPFVVIDWAGANPRGYGIYDLVRVARSFRLSRAAVHKELVAHSAALHCNLQDTRGHLLATLGRLHQHLDHFPENRYVNLVHACWQTFDAALPSTSVRV